MNYDDLKENLPSLIVCSRCGRNLTNTGGFQRPTESISADDLQDGINMNLCGDCMNSLKMWLWEAQDEYFACLCSEFATEIPGGCIRTHKSPSGHLVSAEDYLILLNDVPLDRILEYRRREQQ